MKKQIEVEIDLTAEEIAEMIWDMDSVQQARLLVSLGKIKREHPAGCAFQLEDVKEKLAGKTIDEKNAVIAFVEQVLDYVEEAKT